MFNNVINSVENMVDCLFPNNTKPYSFYFFQIDSRSDPNVSPHVYHFYSNYYACIIRWGKYESQYPNMFINALINWVIRNRIDERK